MSHGGKRDNAGRKAQRGKNKVVSAPLPVSALEIINARYANMSEFIRMAVIEKLSKEVESLPAHLMGEMCRPLAAPLRVVKDKVTSITAAALLRCEPANLTDHILQSLLGGLKVRTEDYVRETGFGRATGYKSAHGTTELKQAKWMLQAGAADLDTLCMGLSESYANDHGATIDAADVRLELCEVLRIYQTRTQMTDSLRDSMTVDNVLYTTIQARSEAAYQSGATQQIESNVPYSAHIPADVLFMIRAQDGDTQAISADDYELAGQMADEQLSNMSAADIDALNAEYDQYFAGLSDTQRVFLTSQYEKDSTNTPGESPAGTVSEIVSSNEGQTFSRYITTTQSDQKTASNTTVEHTQLRLIA
jgi:hypothetical protein